MDDKQKLKDKRVHFIGDRVVFCQALLLLLTGTISMVLSPEDITGLIILAVLGTLGAIFIIAILEVYLFFEWHWILTFLLLCLFWLPVTLLIGVSIDSYVHGFWPRLGNTFWVSLIVMGNYVTGYVIARAFHVNRFNINRKTVKNAGIWMVILIPIIGFFLGWLFNLLYIIVSGIGVALSAVFTYWMLFSLHDTGGMDVIEDPPNKLFMVCLRNSMLLTMIFWVIVLTFFPIMPGGGGGKSKRRSSSRSSSRSSRSGRSGRYRGRRSGLSARLLTAKEQQVLKVRTYKGYPNSVSDQEILKDIVEGEWAEHQLGGYNLPAWALASTTSMPEIGSFDIKVIDKWIDNLSETERERLYKKINQEFSPNKEK